MTLWDFALFALWAIGGSTVIGLSLSIIGAFALELRKRHVIAEQSYDRVRNLRNARDE